MDSHAAGLEPEYEDNMGAGAAKAAAEALTAAALAVESAAGEGDELRAAALVRLSEATLTAERLYTRQLSVALVRAAFRATDYDAGYTAGLGARRRLRSVS
jgi:hypothetical protein